MEITDEKFASKYLEAMYIIKKLLEKKKKLLAEQEFLKKALKESS